MSENTGTKDVSPAPVSSARAWWAIAVLFLAYAFAYIDRAIVSLLVQPLKADLGLSDSEIGLLTGLAFALFYAIMAFPLARLSDSGSRRAIIGWGIVVWSLCTAVSGFATKFWHLFVARMGVGVGEAVLGPGALSLIADLFPKERRGLAMAVFATAMQVGAGLAFIVGGAAISAIVSWGPLWDGLRPWQTVFFIVGLPGLIVAALMFTIPEPRRALQAKQPAGSMSELFGFMRTNWFVLMCHFLCNSLFGAVGFASQVWGIAFLMRHFQLDVAASGLVLGIPLLFCAPVGNFFGGWLINMLTRKGREDAPMLAVSFGLTLSWICVALTPQMPTPLLVGIMYGLAFLVGGMPWVGAQVSLQAIVPARLRAQVAAIYFFVVTVISIIGGSSIVALFTDFVFKDPMRVGDSITLTVLIAGPLASIFAFICLKRFRALAKANAGIT